MIKIDLLLTNSAGLHARPAAELIKTASKFKSKVTLEGKGKKTDAKSIFKVLSLGLVQGDKITITADGPDEKNCIDNLKYLVEQKFYE